MTKKKDKRWILRKRSDYYYNLAKRENYRSRSTYKLFELNKKLNLIKEKDIVIDLGCAPGGWLQASRKIVGENGIVVGIDLLKIAPFEDKNIFLIQGDMRKKEILTKVLKILNQKKRKRTDLVISDASPNISGIWEVDHARSISLTITALLITTKLLKKNGHFIVKSFQGYLFNEYLKMVSGYFKSIIIEKPLVSKKNSAEVYIVGKGFNGKNFQLPFKGPLIDLTELKF